MGARRTERRETSKQLLHQMKRERGKKSRYWLSMLASGWKSPPFSTISAPAAAEGTVIHRSKNSRSSSSIFIITTVYGLDGILCIKDVVKSYRIYQTSSISPNPGLY